MATEQKYSVDYDTGLNKGVEFISLLDEWEKEADPDGYFDLNQLQVEILQERGFNVTPKDEFGFLGM